MQMKDLRITAVAMIIALATICTPFVIAEQPVEAKCDCRRTLG